MAGTCGQTSARVRMGYVISVVGGGDVSVMIEVVSGQSGHLSKATWGYSMGFLRGTVSSARGGSSEVMRTSLVDYY